MSFVPNCRVYDRVTLANPHHLLLQFWLITGEDEFCEIRWRLLVVVVRVVEVEGNAKNNNNLNISATYECRVQSRVKFCIGYTDAVSVTWFFLLTVVNCCCCFFFMVYSQLVKAKYHVSFTVIISSKFTIISRSRLNCTLRLYTVILSFISRAPFYYRGLICSIQTSRFRGGVEGLL